MKNIPSNSLNTERIGKNHKKSNFFDKKNRLLTDREINQIGISHNEALLYILTTTSNNYVQTLEEFKQNIFQKYPNLNESSSEIKSLIESSRDISVIDFDRMVNLNSIIINNPSKLKKYVNSASTLTDNYVSFEAFENALMNLDNQARAELIGLDLDAYLVFSSVYKNSTKFWYEQNVYNSVKKFKPTRSGVATGVAAAAGSGGLAMPVVAIVMELVGIGFGAALSSGAYLLGIGS